MSVFYAEVDAADTRVAGFWIRAAARALDSLVVGFVIAAVAMILALVVLVIAGADGEPRVWIRAMGRWSIGSIFVSLVGDVLYHTFSEFVGGASLGKRVVGLRVVSDDFGPVSLTGALTRSAAIAVDGLFFGWIAYRAMDRSPLCQRLGDRWGDTTVVKLSAFPAAGRGAPREVLGIFLGLAAWFFVLLCANVSKGLLL